MMRIKFLKDRSMVISATGPERKDFKAGLRLDRKNENSLEDRRMETEILHWLSDMGYSHIGPEDVGALTSAPMVADDPENPTEVWAFMSYAVTSIPTELAEHGYAVFQHSVVERKGTYDEQVLEDVLKGI